MGLEVAAAAVVDSVVVVEDEVVSTGAVEVVVVDSAPEVDGERFRRVADRGVVVADSAGGVEEAIRNRPFF